MIDRADRPLEIGIMGGKDGTESLGHDVATDRLVVARSLSAA